MLSINFYINIKIKITQQMMLSCMQKILTLIPFQLIVLDDSNVQRELHSEFVLSSNKINFDCSLAT